MKLKLFHKLLIALFTCTALVLVLITTVTRFNIGRDFVDFLQQQERGRAEQLVQELVGWYGDNGNWDKLANSPRSFYDLVAIAWPQGSQIGLQRGPQDRFRPEPELNPENLPPPRQGRRGSGPASCS